MSRHCRLARGRLVVSVCVFTAWITLRAAGETIIFEKPLSQRTANYRIHVTLDDLDKRITGNLVLTWKNPSDGPIDELQFHLYLNAFKNAKSTFIREALHSRAPLLSGRKPRMAPWDEDDSWGGIRIDRMEVDGTDVTERIAFYQPDDENADDQTVIRVPLPAAIAPHESAHIEIAFEAKIPRCGVRTGWWQDDFFMMAQWFPKIGVYETPGMRFVPPDAPRGRWNCHQFHAATEFYADYGVYDVEITLPEKYVVGATGLITEERVNGDGTKTVVAHAEDVHDFAWVADAQFREAKDTWRNLATGRQVEIRLLYQPAHEGVVDKYLDSTRSVLDYVDRWLGPGAYPYPNITVVDPRSGSGAGGMEYPTLITGGAKWWADHLFGDGLRLTEMVTIHEFMHQIWYGIVGNNEFEEAWLDEGFTSYSENRISAELFGEKTSMLNWWGASGGGVGLQRAGYATARSKDDGSIADWTFAHWNTGIGRVLAYGKGSLTLKTLDNYLGRERFDAVMRTYFQRWAFQHPTRNDFIAVANEVAGENLDWFFDQVINQASSLDYAVASVASVPVEVWEKGIFTDELVLPERDEEEEQPEQEEDEDKVYHCTVVFRRIGEMVFPMDVLIEFSNGEVMRDTWDGRGRVKTYRFMRSAKVIRAAIDPDNKVPLDVDRLNNSLRIENEQITNKYTLKGFFWLQSLLQLFSILG